MYPLTYAKYFKLVAAILVIMQMSSSARTDEFVENLGPHEPIITELDYKRVIAFQTSSDTQCALHAVVWDTRAENAGTSAARIRVGLEQAQIVHIDTAENKTLGIQCDDEAKTLARVENDEHVAFGLKSEEETQKMEANASNF